MPAKTEKQAKFMRAVAHSPEFAKKVGVPMSVGKEFSSKESGMARTKKMAFGGLPDQAAARAGTATAPAPAPAAARAGTATAPAPAPAAARATGLKNAAAMSGRAMPTAGARPPGMKKGGFVAPSKMGKIKTAAPSINGVATKGKTVGKQIKMAGSAKGMKRGGKCG